jgi:hypothetical protein
MTASPAFGLDAKPPAAHASVAKIWHHNQRSPPNSQHFGQQASRIANLLQCLAEHSEVKTVVRDILQSAIQIRLNHRQATLYY